MLSFDGLPGGYVDGEVTALPLNPAHLSAITDVQPNIDTLLPGAQYLLALAGNERYRAAQLQETGLVHDMLAFLVLLDRFGKRIETLEQDVAGRGST